MAYLPFYITPEEFAEKQKQQEQEIASGRNQISWHKYDIEESFRYLYLCYGLVPLIPLFILTYVLFDRDEVFLNVMMIGLSILMSGVCYLTFGLDYRYDYTLSDRGLVVNKRRNMPRWVNSASQVAAWFGAIVCIFAVSVAGPMILAGAGGLILLSFTGLKRQPDEETEVRIGHSEDGLCARFNSKRKVIELFHKFDSCGYQDVAKTIVSRYHSIGGSYLFFSSQQQMVQVLELLSNEWKIPCEEFTNTKTLFSLSDLPELFLNTPFRGTTFPVNETQSLRSSGAPLPEFEYFESTISED
ncbi:MULTISPECIES: hypothetical protein [Vibrio]|uniref:hypothetical protein n=1 Tax=Vibrio TaxID=662 RepID=UPI00207533E2|nr:MULTISPECIES: hypothetical protein [Vibrio]USD32473.1 hypothetical protein J8Z27_14950 [Vibrio sp. SCSIO 43186]USD45515.1 hypothetical protein J4N38_15340 [Vibrio sp. SCSIO 43145]USD69598.1 hypothetical protein J4N41_14960 [Vibrio sp. SCSIO 43139]USD97290.1 hypothetical protein CTT30_15150 [Vibrio coralliilyticus]